MGGLQARRSIMIYIFKSWPWPLWLAQTAVRQRQNLGMQLEGHCNSSRKKGPCLRLGWWQQGRKCSECPLVVDQQGSLINWFSGVKDREKEKMAKSLA